MKKKAKWALVGIASILFITAAFVLLPTDLEGYYQSPIVCMCESKHFIRFSHGKIAEYSTIHNYATKWGTYRKTGIWKYEFTFDFGMKPKIFNIYSFKYFIYMNSDEIKSAEVLKKLPDDKEIIDAVNNIQIINYSKQDGIVYKIVQDKDFNETSRSIIPKKSQR